MARKPQIDKIWNNVDKALTRRGVSLLELSERSGINYDTMRGWRAKHVYPQVDDAKKMADALSLGIDETFYGMEQTEQDTLIDRLLEAEKKLNAIKEILN